MLLFSEIFSKNKVVKDAVDSALRWIAVDSAPLIQALAFRLLELSDKANCLSMLVDYRALILDQKMLNPEDGAIQSFAQAQLRAFAAWNFAAAAFVVVEEESDASIDMMTSFGNFASVVFRRQTLNKSSAVVASAALRFFAMYQRRYDVLDKNVDKNGLESFGKVVRAFVEENWGVVESCVHELFRERSAQPPTDTEMVDRDFETLTAVLLVLTSIHPSEAIDSLLELSLKLLRLLGGLAKSQESGLFDNRLDCTFGLHEFIWVHLSDEVVCKTLGASETFNLQILFALAAPPHYVPAQLQITEKALSSLDTSDETKNFMEVYRKSVANSIRLNAVCFGAKKPKDALYEFLDLLSIVLFHRLEKHLYPALKPSALIRVAHLYDLALIIHVEDLECFDELYHLVCADFFAKSATQGDTDLLKLLTAFQGLTAEFIASGRPALAKLALLSLSMRMPKDFRQQWWEETQDVLMKCSFLLPNTPVNVFFCIAFHHVQQYAFSGRDGDKRRVVVEKHALKDWGERVEGSNLQLCCTRA
ncbi:hypothetical protein BC829DRAFT_394259 [Chytridium lagenaria]|nr:hypothetical protein BC829DRAFT_394259 [Chytridium lagenaria]